MHFADFTALLVDYASIHYPALFTGSCFPYVVEIGVAKLQIE